MSTHTRVNLEATVDYECAFNDCGHETRPCPTTTVDACKECSDRSMSEYEGGVVEWSECNGHGALWCETTDQSDGAS